MQAQPAQIGGALALLGEKISTKTLYNHLHRDKLSGGFLHLNLRIKGRRRYRHRNKAERHKIPNRKDISERPSIVDSRSRYGVGVVRSAILLSLQRQVRCRHSDGLYDDNGFHAACRVAFARFASNQPAGSSGFRSS
jgi:IS30 family transposase